MKRESQGGQVLKELSEKNGRNPFRWICERAKRLYRENEGGFFRLCIVMVTVLQLLCLAALSAAMVSGGVM